MLRHLILALVLSIASMTGVWAAPSDVGVVLLHGKWSGPKAPGVRALADALAARGYHVANIEMPWSRNRMYDRDYGEALAEVDAAVTRLKSQGASRILVGGHSFGANGALAYGTRHEGLAGLILMAPGHSPDYQASVFASSVARARAMVAEGKPEEVGDFDDSNQGKTRSIQTRARIYLSYFDPAGLGAMSVSAPQVRQGTAVLLVIGRSDRWASRAQSVIFDKTPANPRSRYLEIDSDHMNAPKDGLDAILEWVRGFE